MSHRQRQISIFIKKLASEHVSELLESTQVTLLTVTAVEVSNDFSYAKIFVSNIRNIDEKEEKTMIEILNRNVYKLQEILNKKLHAKKVPRLEFKVDKGVKHSQRIDDVLRGLSQKR